MNNFIISDNLNSFSLNLEQTAFINKIPLRGTFELTAQCNFNCNMCYIHLTKEQVDKIGKELTNDEWISIAKEAQEAGLLFLTLTGGEVFARKDFKELYIELSKMGFLIQIFSNGYLINEDVISWLKEYPPYSIRFTLYGSTNNTYETVCGVKNGFDKICNSIDLVTKAGIPLYLVGTIVKENVHELNDMIRFAKEKKLHFNYSTSLINPVRGATANIEDHKLQLTDVLDKDELKIDRLYKPQSNLLQYCGSYRKGFWITWNGNLQLCTLLENPHVSLLNSTFIAAWNLLNSKLEKLTMPSKCTDCSYEGFCKRCPGLIAAEKNLDTFCKKAEDLYFALCNKA